MSKVLYVGPYRDSTGWAHGALAYIQALDAAGVEVACRPIKLNAIRGEVPPRVAALEREKFDEYDAVIQNVLPHQLDYHGGYPKNIALYYAETSNFRKAGWADYINTMDEAWVCCEHNRRSSRDSGVTVPINVLPIPCDPSRYMRAHNPLPLKDQLAGNFIFYTVGEFIHRKNWRALIMAFHLEFDVNEPVSLLIKTTPQGDAEHNAWDMMTLVGDYCTGVKQGMKLYDSVDQYKKEIVIAGRFSEDEMMRLHASCDCGIFPSYGEAWSIPAFDAMGMGKTPIVTGYGGFEAYIDDATGWLVAADEVPAYATQMDTFTDLHTSREEWAAIDIAALRKAMREAYEDADKRRKKAEAGMDRVFDFSFEKIGKQMKEVLCG